MCNKIILTNKTCPSPWHRTGSDMAEHLIVEEQQQQQKRHSTISVDDNPPDSRISINYRHRQLRYLILLIPAYLITLGITTNYNPFDATTDTPTHYAYKLMTMILFGWLWMVLVRMFVYFSPLALLLIFASLRLPVESMKNYVEHVRSVSVPFARFTMCLFFLVYYGVFFQPSKNNPDGVDDSIVLKVFQVLAALTGLIFLEAILIRNIGINFHQMAFSERIATNKIALKTIDRLDRAINTSNRDLFTIDLTSDTQAIHQAKKLFDALSCGRNEIVMNDFLPYFTTTEEAHEAFKIFDKNGDGDLIRGELRVVVLGIYEERRALNNSLKDITHAIAKLDKILICVCFFMTVFIILGLFSANPVATIVPFSTMIVGLSFVFGQSARDTFDAILFVFVTHPFDTNDRVYIKDENYVVKELGLLTTTFIRADGQEIYMPNSVLNKQNIHNIRRSKGQKEVIKVDVAFDTKAEMISDLNMHLNEFLENNNRDFDPLIIVNVVDLKDMSKLTLTMMLGYKRNWVDGKKRGELRTKFNLHLKESLLKLGFTYAKPLQPIKHLQ